MSISAIRIRDLAHVLERRHSPEAYRAANQALRRLDLAQNTMFQARRTARAQDALHHLAEAVAVIEALVDEVSKVAAADCREGKP